MDNKNPQVNLKGTQSHSLFLFYDVFLLSVFSRLISLEQQKPSAVNNL